MKNIVDWIGKIDWELQTFHGNEYSTHRGLTYNSDLIQEEKSVLIGTVWKPYANILTPFSQFAYEKIQEIRAVLIQYRRTMRQISSDRRG